VITDEGFMPTGQAERLGLVLCELVVNAALHGGARWRTRYVRIKLSRPGGEWRLAVTDDGWAAPDVRPTPGLGTRFVRGFSAALRAGFLSGRRLGEQLWRFACHCSPRWDVPKRTPANGGRAGVVFPAAESARPALATAACIPEDFEQPNCGSAQESRGTGNHLIP
jgi:hypothetical protein